MERCNDLSLKGSKWRVGNGEGIKDDHPQMSSVCAFQFYNTTASLGQERREKTGLLNNLIKKYRYVRNETCSAQPEPSAHLTH